MGAVGVRVEMAMDGRSRAFGAGEAHRPSHRLPPRSRRRSGVPAAR